VAQLAGASADAGGATGTPADERAALQRAVGEAAAALQALSDRADDALAGEVLTFQIALLHDPELLAPAAPLLARGESAAAAWCASVDDLIDAYAGDAQEYFRARADDLRDLRQRVLDLLGGVGAVARELPEGAILVAETLTPSRFLEVDWRRTGGAALAAGSATSHMAMLARARGVPLVTGLGSRALSLADGAPAVLDAEAGQLLVDPDRAALSDYRARLRDRVAAARVDARYRDAPARTADGTRIEVLINVDDPRVLDDVDPAICDGVGLTRTEFLFRDGVPDEETQFEAYRKVVAWAQGRPVTIRTLDAGGDKPVPGLTPAGESNPFLGVRGLRLSLAQPAAFRTQLRALLRAGASGPLKIMLPMVTAPGEVDAAREIFGSVQAELAGRGAVGTDVAFGVMVETPSAALQPAAFAADFYSIGTNDLVQYVMAAARDIEAVAHLQDPRDPAILELIGRVAAAGRARGVEVSVCGEMAARADCVPALLDAGIRTLSAPPAAVARVKRAVAGHGLSPPAARR
jgi:phosphotransferase system enzyme I (PtsI)